MTTSKRMESVAVLEFVGERSWRNAVTSSGNGHNRRSLKNYGKESRKSFHKWAKSD